MDSFLLLFLFLPLYAHLLIGHAERIKGNVIWFYFILPLRNAYIAFRFCLDLTWPGVWVGEKKKRAKIQQRRLEIVMVTWPQFLNRSTISSDGNILFSRHMPDIIYWRPSARDLCTGRGHGLWEPAHCGNVVHPGQLSICGPAF